MFSKLNGKNYIESVHNETSFDISIIFEIYREKQTAALYIENGIISDYTRC